ncbi:MAG: hypothetical protein DWP97_07305 [Calditrichaeota bacterium]|nr:MAG: hypothetical protein DWP97_07305 [Calditrichota bacterium]
MKYAITLYLIIMISAVTLAQEYKDYKYSRNQIDYFQIKYNRSSDDFSFTGYGDKTVTLSGSTEDIDISNNTVNFKNNILFSDSSLFIADATYNLFNITDTRVEEIDGEITVTFLTTESRSRLERFKKGNRIHLFEDFEIAAGDFCRGLAFSITGKIKVSGEVNKDIISLFGEIDLSPTAVTRGNTITITGDIDFDKESVMYGEIYDSKNKGRGQKHRLFRDLKNITYAPALSYDRVDGLGLYVTFEHFDIDSIYPNIELKLGYGLESDRGRIAVKAEETIKRNISLMFGAAYYKQLVSEDTSIVGSAENTLFALVAREDFKEYRESKGGKIYFKAIPYSNFKVETGYAFYDSKFLPSQRHLWSLFGGSKLFSYNFRQYEDVFRSTNIAEIDSASIGKIYLSAFYSNKDYLELYYDTYTESRFYYENASDGLGSDFEYQKFSLSVLHNQKLNNNFSFTNKFKHANSDGYLPYFTRYGLGGLSTIHGYAQKEYIGTRYFLLNSELRYHFVNSGFGFSVMYDAGKIANDRKLDSEIEFKQSAGLSLFFEEDFKLMIAKRLDRSEGNSPRIYIRFNRNF